MTTCLLLTSDLIFSSRIQQAANHAHVDCIIAKDETSMHAGLVRNPTLVFVDLEALGEQSDSSIKTVRQTLPQVRIIAFGSHVQTDLLSAAKEAGADFVLARSAFVQQLPTLLQSQNT